MREQMPVTEWVSVLTKTQTIMEQFINSNHKERVESLSILKDFCEFMYVNKISDFSTVQKQFEKLSDSTFLTDLVNYELTKINQSKHYVPNRSSFNGWEVVDTQTFTISLLSAVNRNLLSRKVITGASNDRLILSLTKPNLNFSLYRQHSPYPVEIIDKTKKLEVIKRNQPLNYGESFFIHKHHEIFTYEANNSTDNITTLILSTKSATYFDWEYDLATLLPTRIIADVDSSRIEYTCKILGELGVEASLPNLFKLLEHPKHNIRWDAAKSIMMINFDEGINALALLKNDTHPEIRKAVANAFVEIEMLQ